MRKFRLIGVMTLIVFVISSVLQHKDLPEIESSVVAEVPNTVLTDAPITPKIESVSPKIEIRASNLPETEDKEAVAIEAIKPRYIKKVVVKSEVKTKKYQKSASKKKKIVIKKNKKDKKKYRKMPKYIKDETVEDIMTRMWKPS